MNKPAKIEPPTNMRIWDALSKTDPAQTKTFSRAGGFKGTAVKPMWVVKRLTEEFGPCGDGWGIGKPEFQTVPTEFGEILVYCTVPCWHGSPANVIYGVGGDKVLVQRSDRPFHDDEAFKKAFTDAVNNAFKFVGVAADIHMGLFDDSKYVEEVRGEFEAERAEKVPGIHKIKQRLNKLMIDGNAIAADDVGALEAFNALVHECKDELTKIRDAKHQYWTGDGEDFEGFAAWIKRRREEMAEPDESLAYQLLVSTLRECETEQQLHAWNIKNGDVVERLDGAESRQFTAIYDEHEAQLRANKTRTPVDAG